MINLQKSIKNCNINIIIENENKKQKQKQKEGEKMRYKNLLNGEWKESEKEIKIYSPINGEELGTVPAMTREEVDFAMETAKISLDKWRKLAVIERANYL